MANIGNFLQGGAFSAEKIAQMDADRARIEQIARIDYQAVIAEIVGGDFLGWLQRTFPEGKRQGKDYCIGNALGERGKSLKIDLKSGKWIDFTTDEGGDLISLYARSRGLSNGEAALELSGGNPPQKSSLDVRVATVTKPDRVELVCDWQRCPPWQEACECRHPKFGAPSRVWKYRDEKKSVIGYVARYDPAGERKQFVPWTFGPAGWQPKGWSSYRPLYGLELLADKATASRAVMMVEGEKACDAARQLAGDDFIVVTWPGGASAISRVDLRPLAGRDILIWPDADNAGKAAAVALSERLEDEGIAHRLDVLDVSDLPEKWDAADALADGWTHHRLKCWIRGQFAPADGDKPALEPVGNVGKPGIPQTPRQKTSTQDRVLSQQNVPAHLLTIPGALGLGVEWTLATAPTPQPIYAVQAMLGLGSVVMGRRYKSQFNNLTSLYFLVLGKSSTGKEQVKTSVSRLLDAADLSQLSGTGKYSSDSAVVSKLVERPTHITVTDEIGKVIEASKTSRSSHGQEVIRMLMECWGRLDGTIEPTSYSTALMRQQEIDRLNARKVRYPALTLVGLATHEVFYDAIGAGAIEDGMLNRFIVAEYRGPRTMDDLRPYIEPPEALVKWLKETRFGGAAPSDSGGVTLSEVLVDVPHDVEPTTIPLPFSDAVIEQRRAFKREILDRQEELDATGMDAIYGRTVEQAMRVAMIVAKSCGSDTVELEHWQWAKEYVDFWAQDLLNQAGAAIAMGDHDAAIKDAERLIAESGGKGLTTREVRKRSRKFNKLTHRQQNEIVEQLRLDGAIELVEFESRAGRGRKRKAWVVTGEFDHE